MKACSTVEERPFQGRVKGESVWASAQWSYLMSNSGTLSPADLDSAPARTACAPANLFEVGDHGRVRGATLPATL